MHWRELRHAPLFQPLHYGAAYYWKTGKREPRAIVTQLRKKAVEEITASGRNDAVNALRDEGLYSANEHAYTCMLALVAWDDVHCFINHTPEELRALKAMFPDTELWLRCRAAEIFQVFVPDKEKRHELGIACAGGAMAGTSAPAQTVEPTFSEGWEALRKGGPDVPET